MEQNFNLLVIIKVFFLAVAGAFSSLLLYLGLSEEVFAILGWLVVLDFFTGIASARTLKESITSKKWRYGLMSKMSLLLVPIVLALMAKAVGADASYFLNWGVGLLIFSEGYSIIGNIVIIRTKEEIPEWDALSLLARKIRERFEDEKK